MIEILIVAALVLWSAVVVFKKVFPEHQIQSSWHCLSTVKSKAGQLWQSG